MTAEKGAKDPMAGGNLLAVKSAEERRKERELAAMPVRVKPEKPFVPKGDEVRLMSPGAGGPQAAPRDKGESKTKDGT